LIVLKASFRKSFSSLALAALLVLPVMGVAPAIAAAQPVSTRAAASLAFFDQPPVPSEADKGKETKAEESQEAKFRHSATIEWFSKLFGISTCGKGDPMQIMQVGHGAAPELTTEHDPDHGGEAGLHREPDGRDRPVPERSQSR